jgi:hypothetical protein
MIALFSNATARIGDFPIDHRSFDMKKTMIAIALTASFSGAAMAQGMGMGFKAGTTRADAVAASAKAFKRIDANGDGSFDTAEVTTMLTDRAAKNGKTFKPKQATRMIGRADTNADGKVTLEEFQAAAGARFDAADTNKNGTIDADEAKPAAGAAPATGDDGDA